MLDTLDVDVDALRAPGGQKVTLLGKEVVMGAIDAVRAAGVTDASAGETAERAHLLARGFSAEEAARLITWKRRFERRLPEGVSEQRLRFVRWLVAHGRLHEGVPSGSEA
jgi:hypothetical protein